MNAKRQTIWLVSMLGLMVVLSAYYLLSDDVSKLNKQAEETAGNQDEIVVVTEQDPADKNPGAGEDKGADRGNDQGTDKDKGTDKATDKDAVTDEGAIQQPEGISQQDQEVISKVEQQGQTAAEQLILRQINRKEKFNEEFEALMAVISSDAPLEDVAVATEKSYELEQQEAKIDNIEDILLADYRNVLVEENDNGWKVIVQADKLEKSQVVSIFDLVMKELDVTQQYVAVELLRDK